MIIGSISCSVHEHSQMDGEDIEITGEVYKYTVYHIIIQQKMFELK